MTPTLHRLFLLLLCSSTAFAAEMIGIAEWAIPANGQPYPPKMAVVGDSVTFKWLGGNFHNVYFHPNGGCATEESAVEIGISSPAVYTFAEEDGSSEGKEMLFVCDVGGHCASGMQVVFTVYSTIEDKPTEMPAVSPAGGDTPTGDASGSSSVSFHRIQVLAMTMVVVAAMLLAVTM
jgi:plastocyanin